MFWTQFTYLCECAGKSPNAVAAELGISSGSITAWSKGSQPRNSTVKRIAEYFGVTESFLLHGTKHFGLVSENFPRMLSPIALRETKKDTTVSGDVDARDIEIVQLLKKLTDTEKDVVLVQMRGIVQGR